MSREERRTFTRPEVLGNAYELTAVQALLSTDEGRVTFRDIAHTVIEDALSEEGPQRAHELTDEQLNQPLDLEALIDNYEQDQELPLSADAFEMRFSNPNNLD